MSDAEQPTQIVLKLINEVMNHGNVDVIDELVADDFVNHGAGVGPGPPPGVTQKQVFKRVAQEHQDSMGDLRVDIHETLAEGEYVVVRSTLNARHSGMMFGMPPTGNQLAFQVVHVYRVRGAEVTDHWEYRDDGEIFRQLDMLPPPLVKRIRASADQPA